MDLSGLTSVTNASQLTEWLSVNMVTPVSPAISASDMGTIMQKIISVLGTGGGFGLVSFTDETGSYTLALTDKAIDMNVASVNTVTIPANASVAFPVGTQILLTQSGAGQTVVAGASGVTIHSASGNTALATQYSWATLVKRDTNVWWLYGDLAAAPAPPPPSVVNINFTDGTTASSAGWNNMDKNFIGTSQNLDTSTGASSGWAAVASASGTADLKYNPSSFDFRNSIFPNDVLEIAWTVSSGGSIDITISGLTEFQAYLVQIASAYYTSGAGATQFIVGGETHDPDSGPDASADVQSFTFSATSSGELLITFRGYSGITNIPLLNAIIISEAS